MIYLPMKAGIRTRFSFKTFKFQKSEGLDSARWVVVTPTIWDKLYIINYLTNKMERSNGKKGNTPLQDGEQKCKSFI